jgi:ankyrin repeat protein
MSVKIMDKVREYISSGFQNFETFKSDVETLLSNGESIDEFDNYGTNPLLTLAFKGSFSDVQFIVSKNANLDVVDNWGYTALFGSLLDNKVDQAKFIIDSGVNINYIDNRGNSYLDNCIDFKLLDLGKYLFNKNAISNKYTKLEIMRILAQNNVNNSDVITE